VEVEQLMDTALLVRQVDREVVVEHLRVQTTNQHKAVTLVLTGLALMVEQASRLKPILREAVVEVVVLR
jgi:hypothetical protein